MKPSLLILHGALGCKEQFVSWANALSENFACHLLDFPGHGSRSADEAEFSIERFSKELVEYIELRKLQQPHVLGYSMGGYVALYAALCKEGCLGNIMTLATKFNWTPEASEKEAGYLVPERMLQKVPQLAEQLEQRHGSHWKTVAERTANLMIGLGRDPLLTPQSMGSLKNKVKFCVGDRDKMVTVAETQAIFNSSVSGSLCVLPSTGHLPETMDLKRIAYEVQDLLPGTATQQ